MPDIEQFIKCFGHPVRGFPPTLSQSYAELIEQFRHQDDTAGFEELDTVQGFTDATMRGVAHRMHWWFPTHFFKFQDALLRWEQKCSISGNAFLLDRPHITFVDLGCGAGAASAAVLSVLEQYCTFCSTRNVLTIPVKVDLVALDSSEMELAGYRLAIRSYSSRLRDAKIEVRLTTIAKSFPEGIPELISALSIFRGHALIVGMSNLINWIWSDWDKSKNGKDPSITDKITPQEAIALQQLADQTDFDLVHVVGIATTTRKLPLLPKKLSDLFFRFVERIKGSGRLSGKRSGSDADILFENPQGSHWAKKYPQAPSHYHVENIVSINPAFENDRKLQTALSLELLEAAWIKTRTHMRYESLVDQVELKLFEHNYVANLVRLRQACLEREYDYLNVSHDMPYQFPKDEQSTRPRSLARLDEQLVAAAVSLQFAEELDGAVPHVSYSYKFAVKHSEFLYEYWFESYRKYLASVYRRLDEKSVFITDIKGFYTNIPQTKLQAELRERITSSRRCCEILDATILRDCHAPHAPSYGLIQGHSLSGLFANTFLQKMDVRLVGTHHLDGNYSRFTDDITLTRVSKSREQIEQIVEGELQDIDGALRLSPKKTDCVASVDYRKRTRGSRDLNEQAARFRALLLPLFTTNFSYRRECAKQRWQFIYQYHKLLENVGVFFSPEWLYRKTDEYMQPGRWLGVLGRRWRLAWPPVSWMSSSAGQSNWRMEFEDKNRQWLSERDGLKRDLTLQFNRAAEDLLSRKMTEDMLRRKKQIVKFTTYRLNTFGVDGVVDDLTRLILHQPWNVPVILGCQALARGHFEDALMQLSQHSSSGYVRAIALRNVGKVRTDQGIAFLNSVMDDGAISDIEKLMASEALLEANMWRGITLAQITTWLEREVAFPYIQKNIVLILAQAFPNEARPMLQQLSHDAQHTIVQQAVVYALEKSPTENLLWQAEPEVVRKYRAKSYPIIEELLSDEGSYALASR